MATNNKKNRAFWLLLYLIIGLLILSGGYYWYLLHSEQESITSLKEDNEFLLSKNSECDSLAKVNDSLAQALALCQLGDTSSSAFTVDTTTNPVAITTPVPVVKNTLPSDKKTKKKNNKRNTPQKPENRRGNNNSRQNPPVNLPEKSIVTAVGNQNASVVNNGEETFKPRKFPTPKSSGEMGSTRTTIYGFKGPNDAHSYGDKIKITRK
jgi:hypothetical protein